MNELQNEWAVIHRDIEKYERFSLVVKLISVLVCVIAISFINNVWIAITFILILWLQDGVWKTFQKRLEARILFLEQAKRENPDNIELAFQFYSQWEEKRQGVVGLIKEYVSNSLKPTVAYPYVILVFLTYVFYVFIA